MHSDSLKLALLVAVSVSQIAGGTSCCCVTRFLASALTICLPWKIPSQVTAGEPANENACPKCCCHRMESKSTAVVLSPSSHACRAVSISGDGKCHCVRQVSICAPGEKPYSGHKLTSLLPFPNIPNLLDQPPTSANAKAAYSPPIFIRPAGPSWQSLACVWNS